MANMVPGIGWPGWETVRLIGRGSFGAVYEIRRESFGEYESCALKHIPIPQSEDELLEMRSEGKDEESISRSLSQRAKEVASEYNLMMRLSDCPYVVSCRDVEYRPKNSGPGWDVLIRMELLTPLIQVLSRQPDWPEEEIVHLGRDMAAALVACGRRNILHRDIKPQNIFVDGDGNYKLGDFGIARIAEKTGAATARIGTYTYMAPEVYRGERYGAQADIYSLGMVLYWLLNERRGPFVTENTPREKEAALNRRMRGEPIPPPAHGSPWLQRIALKACAYDPKDRYQTPEELLQDLTNQKGPTPKPDPKRARKKLLPICLAAAAVLALTLILLLLPKRPKPATVPAAEGTAEPVSEPTAEPTPEPTPEPASEPAPAATPEPVYVTGDFWKLEDGVLTVSGNGSIPDYPDADGQPWADRREEITRVVFGEGITGVGEFAFCDCTSLSAVEFPHSVRTIGSFAFSNCSGLTAVEIPSGVTTLGEDVFSNCSGLRSVQIPASVTAIGGGLAFGCPRLTEILVDPENAWFAADGGVLFNKEKTVLLCYPGGKEEDRYEIPSGVTAIGDEAFAYCFNLRAIEIPGSVSTVGDMVFTACTGLTEILVDPENAWFAADDGVLFNKEKTVLLCYPGGKEGDRYVIPSGVTTIGKEAFMFCFRLSAVQISDGVKGLDSGAFFGCRNMRSVEIPDSVAYIDSLAFCECDSLPSVEIPSGVKAIGNLAFAGCESMRDVYFDGTEAQWNAAVGDADPGLSNQVTIHFANG